VGNVYPVEQRDEFEAFLRENRRLRVCAVTPGGNHGDTLIHMGLVKVMEELGIDYTCRNLEEAYDRDRVVGAKYLMNIAADRVGVRRGFRLLDIPAETELILFEGGGYMNDIWYGLTLLRQILRRHVPRALQGRETRHHLLQGEVQPRPPTWRAGATKRRTRPLQ